jgi:hypothetical protein
MTTMHMVVTVLFFFFALGCPVTTGFCAPRPVLVGSPIKMELKGRLLIGRLVPASRDRYQVIVLQPPSHRYSRSSPFVFASALQAVYRPQDSLVAGVAEISMGCSLGVLWSEYAVMTTGCGPLNFSDTLERICYQGVLVAAGMALFQRIVTQNDLAATCSDYFGELLESTIMQVRLSEFLSLLAVVGAFVALAVQSASGAQMDGMSGIDIELCRAIRDF